MPGLPSAEVVETGWRCSKWCQAQPRRQRKVSFRGVFRQRILSFVWLFLGVYWCILYTVVKSFVDDWAWIRKQHPHKDHHFWLSGSVEASCLGLPMWDSFPGKSTSNSTEVLDFSLLPILSTLGQICPDYGFVCPATSRINEYKHRKSSL